MLYIIPVIIGIMLYKLLNKKELTFMLGSLYAIVAALRSTYVGYDTLTYSARFENCMHMSFDTILKEYANEPSYYLLCKTVSLLGGDFQILLTIIAIVSMYALGQLIYKYSPSIITSFVMIVPLQYYGFMLSAERQTIAISLILLGVPFIIKRNFIKFLLIAIAAYSFHNSALFALPLYFCCIKKLDNKKRAMALLLIPILYASKSSILNYGLSLMYTDYSAYTEEQGSYATLFLYFAFWILYTLTKKSDNNHVLNFFEVAAIIGIIIQLFVPLEPNIFRLAFYYQIFNIILLPVALANIKKDVMLRRIGYSSTFVVLMLMYFMFTYEANGINPYTFYWEA